MKKYVLCLVFLLAACTNIDKKEHYYSNAVKIDVVFNKELKGFENAYLRIVLLSDKNEILDEKVVYDIVHKSNNTNTKKILVNFKNYDKTKENKVVLELFADSNNDEIYENYQGIMRETEKKQEYVFDIR